MTLFTPTKFIRMFNATIGGKNALFSLALILYAFFGSPTPDGIGWAEFAVGGLLLLTLSPLDLTKSQFSYFCFAIILFIPGLIGLVNGAQPPDIARDVVALGFLFLYLFYGGLYQSPPHQSPHINTPRFLMGCIVTIGVIFGMRSLLSFWQVDHHLISPEAISDPTSPPDHLYLANSPEVLCSALFLLGIGIERFFIQKRYAVGLLCLSLSLIPMLSMALMMQRASMAAIILTLFLIVWRILHTYPARCVWMIGTASLLCWIFWDDLRNFAQLLWWKTHLVGLNSRVEEWRAVLSLVGESWASALFGHGWGTRLENPAVGGVNVLYTHSLTSALLLKTGFVGAVLTLLPLLKILRDGWAALYRNQIYFLSLFLPFLISATIYASYKSLGFGLILLVFFSFANQKLVQSSPSVA
ncbi:MAG: hypothetical protein JNK24_07005 [Alphaproteobacteria bacterium]|nr:hypothetical protein [Alphaproteobacteria bacterium]